MDKVINMTQDICDTSTIEYLLAPHLKHLYGLAFRLTGRKHDAEDLFHDVLVKIFSRQKEIGAIERLRPWLTTILYRTFIDRKRQENRSLLRLFKPGSPENSISELDNTPSPQPDPEKAMNIAQAKNGVHDALAKLNADQKAICVLHDMEGYTLPELAETLATPIGTLKSRLHRARKNLKYFLQKNGTFPARQSST